MKKLLFVLFSAFVPMFLFAQSGMVWKEQDVSFSTPVKGMKIIKSDKNNFVAKSDKVNLTITAVEKLNTDAEKALFEKINNRAEVVLGSKECIMPEANCPASLFDFMKERKMESAGFSQEINLNGKFYGYMASVKSSDNNREVFLFVLLNAKTGQNIIMIFDYDKSKSQEVGLMGLSIGNI